MRALFLILIFSMSLNADSWMSAEIQTFPSKKKDFIFLIVPAGYQDPRFPSPTTDPEIQRILFLNKTCVGSLMKYHEQSKSYLPIWMRPLANKISPVLVMISEDGEYVVTTGEWGGGGDEVNAIGIYDSDGKIIRSLTVKDILGKKSDEAPRSATVIDWGAVKDIDTRKKELILQVWESGHGPLYDDPLIFRERRVRLIDGSFVDEK